MAVDATKGTTKAKAKAPAARRRRRDQLILDALEQLLADRPLRDLAVEEIAAAAGITRTRFYFYFKSKHEAYAALLERVLSEVLDLYSSSDSWWVRAPEVRPRDAMLETFLRIGQVWSLHGPVLREASDMWNAVPEVRAQWQRLIGELADRTTAAIELERERGVAPGGPPARRLAESVIWYGERVLFLALIEAPGAMSVEEVMRVGTVLWMRTIYLADDPEPA